MSIKVKNSELSNETITALNSLIDTDINATCAFRLTRIIKELSSIVEGAVNITNPEQFQNEMSDLMEIENEIPYDKVNFEDLKLETAKVKDLITLEFLFA